MKNVSTNIKVGVISSLIATIFFLYFLDPILDFLGRLFIKIGSWLFQAYIDRLYQEIAIGSLDYPYVIINGLTLGVMAASSILIFRTFRKRSIAHEDQNEKLHEKVYEKIYLSKWRLLPLLIIFFGSLFLLTTSSINKRTTTSFDQHIRIITPYITSGEKEKIISDFASMQSQKDYQEIYLKLKTIASANNLILPKNKLYPF